MIRSGNQRGDTIIEVLLAMSVIGLVLGMAFGIANRSVTLGQDAQERTEALKIAETQLELFKGQYAYDPAPINARTESQPFCFTMDASTTLKNTSDNECKDVGPGGSAGGLYTISINPPKAADASHSYTIDITWTRLGSATENNTLTLYYKPGSL